MAVKVAINGFGRIGRLAFRQMFGHEGSEICRHQRPHVPRDAGLPSTVRLHAGQLRSHAHRRGRRGQHCGRAARGSPIYRRQTPTICLKASSVAVVLECTGFYTSKAKAQAHINAGAKKVVISAPAGKDLPDPSSTSTTRR